VQREAATDCRVRNNFLLYHLEVIIHKHAAKFIDTFYYLTKCHTELTYCPRGHDGEPMQDGFNVVKYGIEGPDGFL
jgi:hypothetical protein